MKEVLVDDENMFLEVEFFHNIPTIHIKMKKWSHTILRNYLYPKWAEVLELLKGRGYWVVMSVIPASDKKLAKFHSILGGHEVINDGTFSVFRRWL